MKSSKINKQTQTTPRNLFLQKTLAILIMLCLTGCSPQICRQWEFQEIITKRPCFNGGRMLLGPDSSIADLELEVLRNRSGLSFYINLLFLEAPPLRNDPSRTEIILLMEGEEPFFLYPHLLEGGQRLLLQKEDADLLIQALLNCCPFALKIGRSRINVIPDNFAPSYKKLLSIPIEMPVTLEKGCENLFHAS